MANKRFIYIDDSTGKKTVESFDASNVSDHHASYEEIDVGETITIEVRKQMIVHGTFVNNGTLINNGRLVLLG